MSLQDSDPNPHGTDRPTTSAALPMCPACRSKLVNVAAYCEADEERWLVDLRCLDCAWTSTWLFDQEAVERLAAELDRCTLDLADELRRVTYENMAQVVDRFSFALARDEILPEDF